MFFPYEGPAAIWLILALTADFLMDGSGFTYELSNFHGLNEGFDGLDDDGGLCLKLDP